MARRRAMLTGSGQTGMFPQYAMQKQRETAEQDQGVEEANESAQPQCDELEIDQWDEAEGEEVAMSQQDYPTTDPQGTQPKQCPQREENPPRDQEQTNVPSDGPHPHAEISTLVGPAEEQELHEYVEAGGEPEDDPMPVTGTP